MKWPTHGSALWEPGRLAQAGLAALSIGSAFIAPTKPFLNVVQLEAYELHLQLGAGTFLVLGVAGLALSGVLLVLAPAIGYYKSYRLERGPLRYFSVQAGIPDLDQLYPHYFALFGQDIVPRDQMTRWMKKNASIVYKVLRAPADHTLAEPELVGFFDIEPLTLKGEAKLRATRPNTLALTESEIRSPRSLEGSAYYVGSIGAVVPESSVQCTITLCFMIDAIQQLARRGPISIYARPATDEGVNLVKQTFGMNKLQHSLPDKEAVWSREILRGTFDIPKACQRYMGSLFVGRST